MSKAKRKTEGALALLTRDLFAVANLFVIRANDVLRQCRYCDHFVTMYVDMWVCVWVCNTIKTKTPDRNLET